MNSHNFGYGEERFLSSGSFFFGYRMQVSADRDTSSLTPGDLQRATTTVKKGTDSKTQVPGGAEMQHLMSLSAAGGLEDTQATQSKKDIYATEHPASPQHPQEKSLRQRGLNRFL